MRKPAVILVCLTMLLASYAVGIISQAIPPWLAVCLAPLALPLAIIVLALLGGYAILVAEWLSDQLARIKLTVLRKYGIQTRAVIVSSELYHGPGLHEADPCFRGSYRFADKHGREHTFTFSKECYDPYDLSALDTQIDEHYQPGAERRLIYLSWWPSFHHLFSPDNSVPLLRGNLGLYRIQ